MPYIDGESLRTRLAREGVLPLTDALTILRELADALAHAHAQGIVHRDLKPDNVLLSERHVFLADFGVACALQEGAALDQTMTATIVGTPAYMSPEQAAGRGRVDHRADIYAFGAMAYEMLAGTPPFAGEAAAVVMAAHLTAVPEPLEGRCPDVPPDVAALVMKCLEKRPEDRWQGMADLLGVLDSSTRTSGTGQPSARLWRRPARRLTAGAVMAIAVALPVAWQLLQERREAPITIGALRHVTRDPGLELDPAISPDGRTLAFVAGPPGRRRLYVRQIEGGARAIALTEAGVAPSQRRPDWSPDGTRIVFQAGEQGIGVRPERRTGALYTVPALGGTPSVLLPSHRNGLALTPVWSPDGSQVAFAADDGLYVMPATGGVPRRILQSPVPVHSLGWSPDGARLVYVAGAYYFALGEDQLGNMEIGALHVVELATGTDRIVTGGHWLDVSPAWTPGRPWSAVCVQPGRRPRRVPSTVVTSRRAGRRG